MNQNKGVEEIHFKNEGYEATKEGLELNLATLSKCDIEHISKIIVRLYLVCESLHNLEIFKFRFAVMFFF